MGFLKNLFRKETKQAGQENSGYIYATELTGGQLPIYSNAYRDNIYEAPIVVQAVELIASEMKKAKPIHIQSTQSDIKVMASSINRVLKRPNPLMTISDLIERMVFDYYKNSNVFVYPVWDGLKLIALYPIYPVTTEYRQYVNSPDVYIYMRFADGSDLLTKYDDIIHIKRRYISGLEGTPMDIYKPVQLDEQLLESVLKNSRTSVNGIVKYGTIADQKLLDENVKKFEQNLQNGKSGILGLSGTTDYIPVTRQVQMIDAETLKFSDYKVLRNLGVSVEMLNGTATVEQKQSFYDRTIEPLMVTFGDAFTKTLLTEEAFYSGQSITFTLTDGALMSPNQKTEMVNILMPAGILMANEIRVLMGLQPLKELEGVRMVSLNWVNAAEDPRSSDTKLIKTEEGNKDDEQA